MKPTDDPGGARTKGYGADPTPGPPIPPTGPIPVATEAAGHARKPDDGELPPTGRDETAGVEHGRILGGGA